MIRVGLHCYPVNSVYRMFDSDFSLKPNFHRLNVTNRLKNKKKSIDNVSCGVLA